MAITKEKKEEILEEYLGSLEGSYAVVLVHARGLNVAEVSDLRNKIREAGGKYSVIKNTLFRLALAQRDMPVPEMLTGPLAATFCPEEIATTVKVIQDFGRAHEDKEFRIVGGILESQVLNGSQAESLASLPTKSTLFAQILGGLNAPSVQMLGVMTSGIRQVLNVLQARIDQLQQSEAAA